MVLLIDKKIKEKKNTKNADLLPNKIRIQHIPYFIKTSEVILGKFPFQGKKMFCPKRQDTRFGIFINVLKQGKIFYDREKNKQRQAERKKMGR